MKQNCKRSATREVDVKDWAPSRTSASRGPFQTSPSVWCVIDQCDRVLCSSAHGPHVTNDSTRPRELTYTQPGEWSIKKKKKLREHTSREIYAAEVKLHLVWWGTLNNNWTAGQLPWLECCAMCRAMETETELVERWSIPSFPHRPQRPCAH